MGLTKEFQLADVLGVLTGRVLGDMSGIYAVCEFMSGEPVWTHQIPRVCREARPVLLAQHPQLALVVEEAASVTRDNWQELLAGWQACFGSTITLAPMTRDQHERIDPVSELAEMVPPERIIVVET